MKVLLLDQIAKVNYKYSYSLAQALSDSGKIGRIIKADGITVLHTQWVIFSPVDYYFLNKFKKKNCVKLITTVHDILPFNEKFYDKCFHKKIYELSDSIIVQAQQNLERINSIFNNYLNNY